MDRFTMNSQYRERRIVTFTELAMINTDVWNTIMSYTDEKGRKSFASTSKRFKECYTMHPMYIVYDAECSKNYNWYRLTKRMRRCAGPAYWGPVQWIKLNEWDASKTYWPPIKAACLRKHENLNRLKSIPSLTSLILSALIAPTDLSPNDLLLQLSTFPLLKCLCFHYYHFKECDISQGFLSFKKLEELYLTECGTVNNIRFSQNLKRFMISASLGHDMKLDASLCCQLTHTEFRCQGTREGKPPVICLTAPECPPTITKVTSNFEIKVTDNKFAAFAKVKKIDFYWIPFRKFCGIQQRLTPDQILNHLDGPVTMDLGMFIDLKRLRIRGLKMKRTCSFSVLLPSGDRVLEVEYMNGGDPCNKLLATHQIQLNSQNSKVFMGPLVQIPIVQIPIVPIVQKPIVPIVQKPIVPIVPIVPIPIVPIPIPIVPMPIVPMSIVPMSIVPIVQKPIAQKPIVQIPTMPTQEPTVVLTPKSYTTPMVTPALQKLLNERNSLHTLTCIYPPNITMVFNNCNGLQDLLKTYATASELLEKNSLKYSMNHYPATAKWLKDEIKDLEMLLDAHRKFSAQLHKNVNDVHMLYLSYSTAILVFSQHSTAAQHLPSISNDQLSKNYSEAFQKISWITEMTSLLFSNYSKAVDKSRRFISEFNCLHQRSTQAS
jgi:hypothetical protein